MRKTYLFLICLLLLAGAAWSKDPDWSGLAAVAVSPDGKTVATGGQNRVIYILDAAGLQVKNRIWFKGRIGSLAFNKDGSKLLAEDDDETLWFFDTKTWTPIKQVQGMGYISAVPAVDLVAGIGGSYSAKEIRVLSMTDGSPKASIPLTDKVSTFALDRLGKKLVLLTEAQEGEEKKVGYSDIPKDLQGLRRKEFEQKNDGKTSQLIVFALPAGQALSRTKIWYSSGQSTILIPTDTVTYLVNYENVCAKIDSKGQVELFEGSSSYNYGRGNSPDGSMVLVGGLRDGTLMKLKGMEMAKFQIDSLPGWPEYFAGFAFTSDGTGYGVTSSFRLVKITALGLVEKTVPVF